VSKSSYTNPPEPKMEGKGLRARGFVDNASKVYGGARPVRCSGCGARGVANRALLTKGKLLSCVNCR
jgi:hypothetical protein